MLLFRNITNILSTEFVIDRGGFYLTLWSISTCKSKNGLFVHLMFWYVFCIILELGNNRKLSKEADDEKVRKAKV
jgi:hypothetical protein